MDPKQITSLANLLRDTGDKVLNSEFKLTLSGSLLRALNDSFTLISADQSDLASPLTFQVVKVNNSKSDVFRDLQLIHDFVQKTIILCITNIPNDDYFDGIIDITKFHSLKRLEIQKVNIKQIIGIQRLRAQLQHLICIRSLNTIDDIITYCGGDNSNGFVWNELKLADFSYNNLKMIDTSLEFAQWLQQLNLSHNQLQSCDAIKWLPNLKILNLSFNRLQTIPIFHLESTKRLQILIISHNFIENLNGLQRLDALIELDLSNNCLLDHTLLLPLNTLITLRYLNLYGNPLYCHPKHRQATAYYLHKNTASVKFILDSEPLSKQEKQFIGNYQSHHHHQYLSTSSSRLSLMTAQKSSGQVTPQNRSSSSYNHRSQGQTPASSVGSMASFILNPNETSGAATATNSEMTITAPSNEMMTTSICSEKQKKLRRRTVDLEQNPSNSSLSSSKNNSSMIELNDNRKSKTRSTISASTDHLETKKQIEDLRQKYGASWLHSDNSHMIKSVIGLNECNEDEEDNDNNKRNKMTSKQLIDDLLGQMNNTQKDLKINDVQEFINNEQNHIKLISSTPKSVQQQEENSSITKKGLIDDNDKIQMNHERRSLITTSDDNSIYKSISDEGTTGGTLYNSANEDDTTTNILNDIYPSANDEPEFSEPEDNENTYIVYGTDQNNEFLLTVSDTSIKEKEVLTRRTRTKWSLKLLQSCDRIKANTIRINFDTIKKDKKERVYTIEEGLCQELENYLRGILSQRLLSEMNQTIYRCVNCACQFSRENTYKKNIDVFCPECKSAYVVEIHESPVQNETLFGPSSIATKTTAITTTTMQTATITAATSTTTNSGEKCLSVSHSSTGSAGSLNESSSCSKISQNSQSSFDSNQSVAGSSTNERDLDLLNFCAGKNYESDVEILSNPSQSSIEVLDGILNTVTGTTANNSGSGTAHSSRKTSSEERRLLQIPSLETIGDHNTNLWNYDLQNFIINSQTGVATTKNDNATTTSMKDDEIITTEKEIEGVAEGEEVLEQQQQKKTTANDLIMNNNGGKKNLFVNVNLTESSSSGSVTDSICTTYEQNDKVTGSVQETIPSGEEGGNDGGASTSGYFSSSGGENEVTSGSGNGNNQDQKNSTNNKISSEKENKKDDSIISSMLGGLFQSTNMLMSRTQKSNTGTNNTTQQQIDKFKFNYEDFGDIDHRLKLYFYQMKFDDANEHFKWLVKGKIFNEQSSELYEGIIVMSTTKFYVMEIYNNENDDISKWLKQQLSIKIDRIDRIQLLPWHMGLSFQIRNSGTFLLILQDILRTDSLLLFFANNPLPENCILDYQISEKVLKKLTNCTDSEQLKMFSLLNKCEIITPPTLTSSNNENLSILYSPTGLITTDTHLYLTSSNLSWLSYQSDSQIELCLKQLMSNLVDIDRLTTTQFSINFIDETQDKSELWKCEFETRENADSCLNAIGQSWEKLFGVPLGCN